MSDGGIDVPAPMDAPDDTPAPPPDVPIDTPALMGDTPADTPPPPLRSCFDLYGRLPGYEPCADNPDSCEFWTSGSCYDGCFGVIGTSPANCWDDSGGHCGHGDITKCANTSIICLCPRIP